MHLRRRKKTSLQFSMLMAERVRASGLPLDQLVVIGSGLLDQLGLREAHDIDLAVSTKLFVKLKQSGVYVAREKNGQTCLENEAFEIWEDWGRDASFEKLWQEGQTLDGVRFVSTAFLIEQKQARGLAKDKRDIALLKQHVLRDRQIGS